MNLQHTRTRHTFSFMAWLWAASLVVAPLVYVLLISFMKRGVYGGIEHQATAENYTHMFSPTLFPTLAAAFIRSLWLAFLTTVACILVGFPLALFLVFRAGRFKNTLFFLLIIPFWTIFLVRTYAWMVILSDNGWLNHILSTLGLSEQATHLLFTPHAVFLGMFYNYLPYMAMSLYVSAEKLDVKLLEAAADLGAGPLRRFFRIIVPLCIPGLIAGSIMVFICSLGEFVIPDILGGGTNLFVGNLLAQQFLVARHWPFGAAISVWLIAITVFLLYLLDRLAGSQGEDVLA